MYVEAAVPDAETVIVVLQDGYIFPFLNGIEPTSENENKIKEAINSALALSIPRKVIAEKLELEPKYRLRAAGTAI